MKSLCAILSLEHTLIIYLVIYNITCFLLYNGLHLFIGTDPTHINLVTVTITITINLEISASNERNEFLVSQKSLVI